MRLFQVYCLPDNYEVSDRSLDDIRHVLNPGFLPEEVRGGRHVLNPGFLPEEVRGAAVREMSQGRGGGFAPLLRSFHSVNLRAGVGAHRLHIPPPSAGPPAGPGCQVGAGAGRDRVHARPGEWVLC